MGAWIETHQWQVMCYKLESHPTWVRGLKQNNGGVSNYGKCVAPYVGAWIETIRAKHLVCKKESHPTWVRGLKLVLMIKTFVTSLSHPTRVRGLKLTVLNSLTCT